MVGILIVGHGAFGEALLHCCSHVLGVRPSQMPGIKGHSIGNSNVVKAGALFEYLRDRVLPTIMPPALAVAPAS